MAFSPRILLSYLVAALALTSVASETLIAEGFRIQTKIFVGKAEDEDEEDEPVSETTTLFLDGVVYDFLEEPAQVAVFRKPMGASGRFILLNTERGTRTELSTEQLGAAMDKLRNWAGQQRNPLLRFAAAPKFEESFMPETGKLVLASHQENYTVETGPDEHPEAVAKYREFLDWYTRLNTLLSAGPPPEPRLRLNEALARHNAVPLKVELTRHGEKEPLRAVHEFTWRLSREDMARIDGVRASLASYRPVSNEEFLRSSPGLNKAE
jgi:hypothetical protein